MRVLKAREALIAQPRSEPAISRNATATMDDAFAAAEAALEQRLDNFAPGLEDTAPHFVREYQTARSLAGSQRQPVTGQADGVPQMPTVRANSAKGI
jgi:hypothetical protein